MVDTTSPAEVDGIDADAGPQGMEAFRGQDSAPCPLYMRERAVAWYRLQHHPPARAATAASSGSGDGSVTGLYNRHFFDQYHH